MKKLIITVLIIAVAITFIGGNKSNWKDNCEVVKITICKGDTLSDIAERYKPSGMDYREYVYEIEKLNDMETANIYEGDTILIYKGVDNND